MKIRSNPRHTRTISSSTTNRVPATAIPNIIQKIVTAWWKSMLNK
jgi:hypothetical protein